MQISVTSDINKAIKSLSDLQKKQIPYAASKAINDTAVDARNAVQAQAEQKLDKPTRQTLSAFKVKYANKRDLVGEVFILPWAYEYLKYQIAGGTRPTRGHGTGVPTKNARLNQYGNIPARKKGLVKNSRQFIATIRGIEGVWEKHGRGGKAVRLVVAFEKSVNYKPRLFFHYIVQGVIENKFVKYFDKNLKQALASAR